jgi:hypothetical protein
MILPINDALKIFEIQEKFQKSFPHLKIEFYKGVHALKINKPAGGYLYIKDISKKHEYGEFVIKSSDSAGKVCKVLKKQYGILSRIFLLQGGEYILLKNEELLATNLPVKKIKTINATSDDDEEIRLFI